MPMSVKNFFKQPMIKRLIVGIALFAIVWSVAWSIQRGIVDLWPFAIGVMSIALVALCAWLFRNNE